MEKVKQSLQNALAAIDAWQQNDKAKDERIAELTKQLEAATAPPLPQVSVTGTPAYDEDKSVFNVDWTVSSDTDQPLQVNVRHTDTQTGTEKDYTWGVAGKTGAVYSYPIERVPSDKVTFTILPGEGYTVATPTVSLPVPKQGPNESLPLLPTKPEVKVLTQREPFRITQGGAYADLKIRSTVSKVPCIELRTDQPVTIGGCDFEGAGYIIENHSGRTNLKVINCKAKGLTHDGTMTDPRRFLSVNNITDLEVSNCTTEHMGFLTSQGQFAGSGGQGIRVLRNHVKNISGLIKGGRKHSNFVQLMHSGNAGIPNVQIAFNGVYNQYGESDVEDNINLYNARGRKESRMKIHDNLIFGAYYHPTMERGKYYSGGGIITDGSGVAALSPAHIDVYRNYIIATGNYCLGMAAGFDLKYFDNICVVAGVLPDGRRYHDIKAPNAKGTVDGMFTSGIQATDYYKSAAMHSNEFRNNTLGIRYYDRRNDVRDFIAGAVITGTRHLPDPITTETEQQYVLEWEQQHRALIGI